MRYAWALGIDKIVPHFLNNRYNGHKITDWEKLPVIFCKKMKNFG
jgi:hypothetical protein